MYFDLLMKYFITLLKSHKYFISIDGLENIYLTLNVTNLVKFLNLKLGL